jgi:hypothetical protein
VRQIAHCTERGDLSWKVASKNMARYDADPHYSLPLYRTALLIAAFRSR